MPRPCFGSVSPRCLDCASCDRREQLARRCARDKGGVRTRPSFLGGGAPRGSTPRPLNLPSLRWATQSHCFPSMLPHCSLVKTCFSPLGRMQSPTSLSPCLSSSRPSRTLRSSAPPTTTTGCVHNRPSARAPSKRGPFNFRVLFRLCSSVSDQSVRAAEQGR
jgi:hypothetical protein